MSYTKEEIVGFRLARAHGAFTEAELLRDNNMMLATLNRLYYSAFYAISAYMAQQGVKVHTHSGIKSAFNKELISTGKLPTESGRTFNLLFTYRQDADYKDMVEVEEVEVNELFPEVKLLIELLEKLITENTR